MQEDALNGLGPMLGQALANLPGTPLPGASAQTVAKNRPREAAEAVAKGAGTAIAKTAIDVGNGIAGAKAGANAMLPLPQPGLMKRAGGPQPLGNLAAGGGPALMDVMTRGPTPDNLMEMAPGPAQAGTQAAQSAPGASPNLPPLLRTLAENPSLASVLASSLIGAGAGADAERRPVARAPRGVRRPDDAADCDRH